MKLFFRKEESIIKMIDRYFIQVDRCKDEFRNAMDTLIKEKYSRLHLELAAKVRNEESLADDFRREIEFELYKRALIPESRGDVLGLLETIDKIPGHFELICDQICLQQINIPKKCADDFLLLTDTNIEAYNILRGAAMGFFFKKDPMEEVKRIDKKESESDALERRLIEKIFKQDYDKADKILLKETVMSIGNISDSAQTASDRLTLAIVKRQV